MKHERFTALYRQGKLAVYVDRKLARKFFTHIPVSMIQKETGESCYFERLIVWLAYLLSPVALIASLALGFFAFHYLGFISLIICPLVYVLFSSSSLRNQSGLPGISLLLIAAIVIHVLSPSRHFLITRFAVVYLFSLWSVRFEYCMAETLLKAFVFRNRKAYDYLSKYLMIQETD